MRTYVTQVYGFGIQNRLFRVHLPRHVPFHGIVDLPDVKVIHVICPFVPETG